MNERYRRHAHQRREGYRTAIRLLLLTTMVLLLLLIALTGTVLA